LPIDRSMRLIQGFQGLRNAVVVENALLPQPGCFPAKPAAQSIVSVEADVSGGCHSPILRQNKNLPVLDLVTQLTSPENAEYHPRRCILLYAARSLQAELQLLFHPDMSEIQYLRHP